MGDGAHIGVSASRALDTVLGAEPQPEQSERATREQVEARIRATPDPMTEPKPWGSAEGGDAYGLASDCIAKAFLIVVEADPSLLLPQVYTANEVARMHHTLAGLLGQPKNLSSVLWDAVKARWPDFDEWVGGATGFMVGWAANCVLFIKGEPPAPNPAIVTVRSDES